MSNQSAQLFANDLGLLIHRARQEFELTYAEIVGILEVAKHGLAAEGIAAANANHKERNGEHDDDDQA